MHANNLKVQDFLQKSGIDAKIQLLPAAVHTAKLAAQALDCEPAQIANSLIFKQVDSAEAVLVLCAGDRRVDLAEIAIKTGLQLAKADASFVREQTGFVIGGVAPVAQRYPLRTIIDKSLQRFDAVWVAGGTPNSIVQIELQDLQRITAGEWQEVSVPRAD
ncbi:MAG: prolyl-tRNA editing enzyme YbaK/EbsC (Cys-tRNA(Pro) deacylase) [Planctomycetota bacterium]|jgi:prolyl-tRNA editing enzyme YbaK/EbsC (Cys-tRNA(Pro) deacylase)